MRRTLLAALAWFCLACIGPALALDFPALTGRVVDEAGVLDAATIASLTDTLAALEAKTTDQLVVVTLKDLRGTSIEDYGYQLGRSWRIGQKDKNNGVVLIIAPADRRARIEVGYGLEGTLTDAITRLIIENSILPRFKAGDTAGGIKRGVEDIVQVLSGDSEEWQRRAAQSVSAETSRDSPDAPLLPIIPIVLVGIGLLIFCALLGGIICQAILRALLFALASGNRGSSGGGSSWSGGGGSSWSGGGGSFGGGGASGSW